MPEQDGKAILLHGPSSVGKSTLARALQAKAELPFWHYSIDHIRDSGMLPSERLARGDFAWRDMREAFFLGFRRTLPALLGAGNNLIVEFIVETDAWLDDLVRLLAPFDVFFVAIRAPLAALEAREQARGDRPVGDARRDFETIRIAADFDIEIDSTADLDRNADTVLEAWRARSHPSAFGRMSTARD